MMLTTRRLRAVITAAECGLCCMTGADADAAEAGLQWLRERLDRRECEAANRARRKARRCQNS